MNTVTTWRPWLGLVLRLYIGYQWVQAGFEKLSQPSAWLSSDAAIKGFMAHAATLAVGAHPSVTSWYAWLLQHLFIPLAPLMSYLVAFGETLVGIALILGLWTRLSLWLGSVMNLNYMLAGSSSTNPVMFTIALFLLWLGEDTDRFGVMGYLRTRHPGSPHSVTPSTHAHAS
ncbi:DoxX family protein [mine drainage metagenome]|uniref:DoxX family protein n=1 Tax=mine drainage metagenome TaxID=410659 RepID=T1CF58_9ZZZZ